MYDFSRSSKYKMLHKSFAPTPLEIHDFDWGIAPNPDQDISPHANIMHNVDEGFHQGFGPTHDQDLGLASGR